MKDIVSGLYAMYIA